MHKHWKTVENWKLETTTGLQDMYPTENFIQYGRNSFPFQSHRICSETQNGKNREGNWQQFNMVVKIK